MAQTQEGAIKQASAILGITESEYLLHLNKNEKWCTGCKEWHHIDNFGKDRSRPDGKAAMCFAARKSLYKQAYITKVCERHGPKPHAPRSGDKAQARQRINVLVRTGRKAHPNLIPCVDCGHTWKEGERRHEYDHHLGYEPEHHYEVEAVCTKCHSKRSLNRGEIIQKRDKRGRFTSTG